MSLAKEMIQTGLHTSNAIAIGGSIVSGITAGATQTQAGATALTGANNIVGTVTTANDGVILPVADRGDSVFVRNSGANTLKVYPPLGGAVNGGTANAAVTLAAGVSSNFLYTSSINVVQ